MNVFEALGLGTFGGPGTLAIAASLTAAIRSVDLPKCGYCGLMLPVLEDRVLGERCAEGQISIAALLSYSSVCGTGLDTIPLAGDAPIERVAALPGRRRGAGLPAEQAARCAPVPRSWRSCRRADQLQLAVPDEHTYHGVIGKLLGVSPARLTCAEVAR